MPAGQERLQHRLTPGADKGVAAGPCARAGNNHARGRGAIAAAVAFCLLGAGLLPAAGMAPRPAAAQAMDDNPLVQRGVPAEATAENAVVARDRALASGQRIAYQRMAVALGLPLDAPDAQVEAMVASLVIESERITPRGYSARITVNFRPPGEAGFAAPVPPPVPGARPGGPAVATLEAVANYRSLAEYIEITRRLNAAGTVARVELLAFTGEAARFRLGLRSQPAVAAAEIGRDGLALGAPQDARPGGAWRIGLAAGR